MSKTKIYSFFFHNILMQELESFIFKLPLIIIIIIVYYGITFIKFDLTVKQNVYSLCKHKCVMQLTLLAYLVLFVNLFAASLVTT